MKIFVTVCLIFSQDAAGCPQQTQDFSANNLNAMATTHKPQQRDSTEIQRRKQIRIDITFPHLRHVTQDERVSSSGCVLFTIKDTLGRNTSLQLLLL